MNYYNEIDKFAAAWLRELIKAGHIAEGEVDERSITDVQSEDLKGFKQCHFFAGIGGWSYALRLAGWPDDRPVWTGSCPCQPFSCAGKGEGHGDERHLWPEMFRLIKECRPPILFGEQVTNAIRYGWLDGVAVDLEAEDYAFGSAMLPASGVGANHKRERLYFVAYSNNEGMAQRRRFAAVSEDCTVGRGISNLDFSSESKKAITVVGHVITHEEWKNEPSFIRVDNGLPGYMGRLRGYGNAIVPQVAAKFIQAAVESVRETEGVA